MTYLVRFLSKPNYIVRDSLGRLEGTFRWRWLAAIWSLSRSDRPVNGVRA